MFCAFSDSRKSNEVRVGKDDETFHFHESFLKHLSRYRLSAHNCQFADGRRCGQLLVTSLGGDAKPQTVSIPGHIKSGDKSIVINIETADLKNYKVPGPKVYLSGGVSYPTKQAPLGDPMVCVTENENWCANPLGKYNSKEQCLKVSLAISSLLFCSSLWLYTNLCNVTAC